MLKYSRVLLIAVIAVFVVANIYVPHTPKAHAQDDTKIVCDADLILNLYIAEYFLGYGQVHSYMMEMEDADMSMMLDLEAFDKGQYAYLFDSMMGMMDEGMMDEEMMGEEEMMGMADMMMMSEEDMMGMMGDMMGEEDMGAMTVLTPAVIEGEAAECTALRAELNRYYTALAYGSMMMGMEEETEE